MSLKLSKTRFLNLFKTEAGVFYFRAQIGGKVYRHVLKSQEGVPVRNERVARVMAVEEANRLGSRNALAAGFGREVDGTMTWEGACTEWLGRQLARPDLSEKSKVQKKREVDYAQDVFEGNLELMHSDVFARWWSRFPTTETKCGKISVRTCNKVLDVVKAVSRWVHANGLCAVDGAHGLKHLPAPDRFKTVPEKAGVRQVIGEMRRSFAASPFGKRASEAGDEGCEAADYVEFMAYSGARHAEVRLFCWEDVRHDGVVIHGVKRGRDRFVPFNAALAALVDRLKERVARTGGRLDGRVFVLDSPRLSLTRACKRLGVDHVNLHGLRHFFITSCMEAGVLPATIAKWVGHVDGGVLIAKTYTHIRDDHSKAEARKLVF